MSPRPPSQSIQSCSSRSEEHTSELQSPCNLVCRLLLEKKKKHIETHSRYCDAAKDAAMHRYEDFVRSITNNAAYHVAPAHHPVHVTLLNPHRLHDAISI